MFVHQTFPASPPPLQPWPVWLYEFPFDTTRAIVQLLYSGTLDRCPSVRFQLAHLGGTVPFLAARLAPLERIVFGTDWPYAALPETGSDPAPALAALGNERQRQVDGENLSGPRSAAGVRCLVNSRLRAFAIG